MLLVSRRCGFSALMDSRIELTTVREPLVVTYLKKAGAMVETLLV